MPAQHPQSGSEETARAAPIWRFADFELDAEQRQLRRRGEPVALEPKPFDFLCLLVGQAGSLVTKDQLIEEIWAGRVVTESVITRSAAKVRKALGETTAEQLVTVHGYGYRFEVEVQRVLPPQASEEVSEDSPATTRASAAPPESTSVRTRRAWPWAAAVAVIAVLGVSLLGWRAAPEAARYEQPSIAVLPFANLSPDTESTDYLAGGVHENLLTHLSRVDGLKVISRTSVARYVDTTESIPVIGQRLGVDYVLEGSVQVVGKRLRVNAQLIEVVTDHHHWADVLDGDVADVMEIQSKVAERVAASVGARLTDDVRQRIEAQPTQDASAYEAYLRATERLRADPFGRDSMFRAKTFLDRSISEDPDFALAHALRARVNILMYWFGYDASDLRIQQARADYQQALAVDSDLAEAYIAQGLYRAAGFKDYDGALASYQKAQQLQPSSAEIQYFVATAYRRLGQWQRAVAGMESSLRSDPDNLLMLEDLATTYRWMRRYADARRVFQRILAIQSDNLHIRSQIAFTYLEESGQAEPLAKLIQEQEALGDLPTELQYPAYQLAFAQRNYRLALERLEAFQRTSSPAYGGEAQRTLHVVMARTLLQLDQQEAAEEELRRARSQLERQMQRQPNEPVLITRRAEVAAFEGDAQLSRELGQRALNLVSPSRDPVQFADVAFAVTLAWTNAGLLEEALQMLEQLQKVPVGLGKGALIYQPELDPLRGDVRFKRLLREWPQPSETDLARS